MTQLKRVYFTLALIGLLGCDNYSDGGLFQEVNGSSIACYGSLTDAKTPCTDSDQNKLSLKTVSTLYINSQQSFVNIGGDCNAGGYLNNVIGWEVRLNDTSPVIFSQDSNSFSPGNNPFGDLQNRVFCVNGRFQLNLQVPFGLLNNGLAKQHRLRLQIVGIDQQGNYANEGPESIRFVNLQPR